MNLTGKCRIAEFQLPQPQSVEKQWESDLQRSDEKLTSSQIQWACRLKTVLVSSASSRRLL